MQVDMHACACMHICTHNAAKMKRIDLPAVICHRCYAASCMPGSSSQQVQEGSPQTALLQGRGDSQQPGTHEAGNEREVRKSKRPTAGFGRQYMWCLSRVALQRTREPLTVFTDYAIFALTGVASTYKLTCHSSMSR